MKRLTWLLVLCLVNALALSAGEEHNKPPEGFTAIFNGADLNGWWGASTEDPAKYMALPPEEFAKKKTASLEDIKKHWSVQNGDLVNDGHGLYLTTDKYYGDFEMWVDYKTIAKADSGIYLRGIPQVQIWDYTEQEKFKIGAEKGSGGLWNNSAGAPGKDPLVLADKPFGEWNRFRIVMVGERVTIFLNDKLVIDHARLENYFNRPGPVPRTGPIQLQTHGGEIRWRNVFLKELSTDAANEILRNGGVDKKAPTEEGFVQVFNGKDFEGWAGATDNYEVVDGAIVCKPGKGGVPFTKEVYKDFVVTLEIKIPPAGNNGLSIRYPGTGDGTFSAMCELQVLDNEHEKYAKLDKRQYHGSPYGMAAAARGYLRNANEWNYQRVTVKGPVIIVELNGTRISETDISKVTEFMGGKVPPGKDRTEGHFGFAGHGDAVAFRNIRIKKL